MAGFLIMAGLTGSALAFREELEAWLAPGLHLAASARGTASGSPLDAFVLRERVEAQLPVGARVDTVQFRVEPGRTVVLRVHGPGLDFDEVFADPMDGSLQGRRLSTALGTAPGQLMPTVFALHHSLALPGPWGTLLLGVVSLLWTVDCFVGAWLTWPRGRPALPKWRSAWKVKWRAGWRRASFDLHRAGGLWLWAVLLLFAWSSVMFNLNTQVYQPVMSAALPFDDTWSAPPTEARGRSLLGRQAAHRAAQEAMKELANAHGFAVLAEERLLLNRARGDYIYMVRSTADLREHVGNTAVRVDAYTGAKLGHWLPTGGAAGNTVSNWLGALHMGHVGGLGWRAFVAVTGAMLVMLSLTGMLIWARKRSARREANRQHPGAA